MIPNKRSSNIEKKRRDFLIVVGKSGSGKTHHVWERLKKVKRAIIIDPVGGEYDANYFDDGAELISYIKDKKVFRVAVTDERYLPALCHASMAIPGTTLVIDEAQRVIPPFEELSPEFENVIYRGRHTQTSAYIIAQRASTIHIAMRSQWTQISAFWQTEPADISWLKKATGEELEGIDKFRIGDHWKITQSGAERVTGIEKTIGLDTIQK